MVQLIHLARVGIYESCFLCGCFVGCVSQLMCCVFQLQEVCRKSALRHSREQRKKERRQAGGGEEQGHSQGRKGCVFIDLVRAVETPTSLHHPPHYWRVKGTFKQYQTDRNECRESERERQVGADQQTGPCESSKMRLVEQIYPQNISDQSRSGKYLCENRIGLKGISNELMWTTDSIWNIKPLHILCNIRFLPLF